MSRHRGHEIYNDGDQWRYADTGEPTVGHPRACGHCGRADTNEGYDGCLGRLDGVANACCGHGAVEDGYVQFADGRLLEGAAAASILRQRRE